MNIWRFLIVFLLFTLACTPAQRRSEATTSSAKTGPEFTPPRNVILMIGDGMGLSQITAGMYANGNTLNLESFPFIGIHKPYASDNLITDSAAGATAFASGVKTYNGAIGVNAEGTPVKTILEQAEKAGFATGMVATSTIVHATPASFIAHQVSRKMYEEIAADFLKTDIDLLIGGGKKFFEQREDGRNLYAELRAKGYTVSDYFTEDFSELDYAEAQRLAYFTSYNDPLPVSSGRDYLIPATRMAPNFLKSKSEKGFFLMIEGSQIDWGGHANDVDYVINEMIEFDKAIGEAFAFAEQDGETLVIVTADHETGGFAINPGSTMDSIIGAFTSDYHTATLIPVFAYGPGAELFAGVYENTEIHTKLQQVMRLEKKTDKYVQKK